MGSASPPMPARRPSISPATRAGGRLPTIRDSRSTRSGAPPASIRLWSGGGDEANNDKLLRELKDVPPPARTARYRAVVVVADPSGRIIAEADGCCEGLIGFVRKGTGGFGYDPLFVVP